MPPEETPLEEMAIPAPGTRTMTFAATPEDRADRIAELDELIAEARDHLAGPKTSGYRPAWLDDPVSVKGYKDRLSRLIAHRALLVAQDKPAPWWRREGVQRAICWGLIIVSTLIGFAVIVQILYFNAAVHPEN